MGAALGSWAQREAVRRARVAAAGLVASARRRAAMRVALRSWRHMRERRREAQVEAEAVARGWSRRQLRLSLWRWRWRWPSKPAVAAAAALAPRFGAWGKSLYASRVSAMWTTWLRYAARARASEALGASQRAVSEAAACEKEEQEAATVLVGAAHADAARAEAAAAAAKPVVETGEAEADAAPGGAEAARPPKRPQRLGRFTVVSLA